MPGLTDKKVNLNYQRLSSLDASDMLGKTLELPVQLRKGIELGTEFAKTHSLKKQDAVDWFGLGGSAVAADLLRGFGYELPHFPLKISTQRVSRLSDDPRIVCSYSGNTAEALHAFKTARKDQLWFTMSSGGTLKELAAKNSIPHLILPGGYPPRAAVGYSLGAIIGLFQTIYGWDDLSELDIPWKEIESDAKLYGLFDPQENPALSLAVKLVDRTIVIYTVDGLTMPALATRFRAQLAENSKVWSHHAELPELAHNEIEALSFLGQTLPPPIILFLGSWTTAEYFGDPRPEMIKMMNHLGIQHLLLDPIELWRTTAKRMAVGLRMMLFLDTVTIYLALLRATDPMEIPKITQLKIATTKT